MQAKWPLYTRAQSDLKLNMLYYDGSDQPIDEVYIKCLGYSTVV